MWPRCLLCWNVVSWVISVCDVYYMYNLNHLLLVDIFWNISSLLIQWYFVYCRYQSEDFDGKLLAHAEAERHKHPSFIPPFSLSKSGEWVQGVNGVSIETFTIFVCKINLKNYNVFIMPSWWRLKAPIFVLCSQWQITYFFLPATWTWNCIWNFSPSCLSF